MVGVNIFLGPSQCFAFASPCYTPCDVDLKAVGGATELSLEEVKFYVWSNVYFTFFFAPLTGVH